MRERVQHARDGCSPVTGCKRFELRSAYPDGVGHTLSIRKTETFTLQSMPCSTSISEPSTCPWRSANARSVDGTQFVCRWLESQSTHVK